MSDIARVSPGYDEVRRFFDSILAPQTGRPVDASELAIAPDGELASFTGRCLSGIDGDETLAVFVLQLDSGQLLFPSGVRQGSHLPKWAPKRRLLAYVVDDPGASRARVECHDFDRGTSSELWATEGCIEQLEWSGDGRVLAALVAEPEADRSATKGATRIGDGARGLPQWMPDVYGLAPPRGWRHLWGVDVETGTAVRLSPPELTVWEAAFAGPDALVVVASEGPEETDWYAAFLARIDLRTRQWRSLYRSRFQLGSPTASPSGATIACIEALSSDRGAVCGQVIVMSADGAQLRRPASAAVDVASLAWRDERTLCFAGHRSGETVLGEWLGDGQLVECWSSSEETSGEYYPAALPVGQNRFALLLESYRSPPTLAIIESRAVARRLPVTTACVATADLVGQISPVRWSGSDGVELDGWLVSRRCDQAAPTVVDVHGGPLWLARNRWLGRLRATPLLARQGFSIFYPNPRGSTGRGEEFAAAILGDMGGIDARDVLAGADELVRRGLADPQRIGLHGISYGGYLTLRLVSTTSRFAAAVAVAPISNWVSQHGTSHIPGFDSIFLRDSICDGGGQYVTRSPVMSSHRITTPTLCIAGLKDRNTPPGQAIEMYRRVRDSGAPSQLVLYPREGHGIREMPAFLDYVARTCAWFSTHLSGSNAPGRAQHRTGCS